MPAETTVHPERLAALAAEEQRTYAARTPRSRALLARGAAVMPGGVPMAWMRGLFRHDPVVPLRGDGAYFTDVDGNTYCDFNLADLSQTAGHGQAEIAAAIAEQGHRGTQFLLPNEAAIVVSEALREMFGLPFWQYTLSASGANAEAIRLARLATGRDMLLLLDGKYHGHIDDTLVKPGPHGAVAEVKGLRDDAGARAAIVPFNDLEAIEAVLRGGQVALLLMEPALTNCSLVLPDPGYLGGVRRLCDQYGTLLCFDETHTMQLRYGGFTREAAVTPDILTTGKGLGSGIPLGAYGLTAPLARVVEDNLDVDIAEVRGLGTGGTLYGNPLSLVAAATMLRHVLTPDGFARIAALGAMLADGIDDICARHGLPWRAFRCGPRSGFCAAPTAPRNAAEAIAALDPELVDTRRLFLANRGIWDAVISAGPQVGFAHRPVDVSAYLTAAEEFVDRVTVTI